MLAAKVKQPDCGPIGYSPSLSLSVVRVSTWQLGPSGSMQLPRIQAWATKDGENLNTYIISYRHWGSTDRHRGGLGRQEHMRQYPMFVHNLLDHVSGCHLHGHWKRWPIIGHHSYRCWSCKKKQVIVKIYRMIIIQVCSIKQILFLFPLYPSFKKLEYWYTTGSIHLYKNFVKFLSYL